jgi:hypothetical protein
MTNKMDFNYWKGQLDEMWLESMAMVHRGKDIDRGILDAFGDLISQPERLEQSSVNDFKKLVNSWLANQRRAKITPVVKKFTLDDLR